MSKRNLDQNSQFDMYYQQPTQSKTLRTDPSSKFDQNDLYQISIMKEIENSNKKTIDMKIISQAKHLNMPTQKQRQPVDGYMNQTNPVLANPKQENKYHVEGLHFQPKGKNVLQGVMNAFNSNEGIGVSIRQNVIQIQTN